MPYYIRGREVREENGRWVWADTGDLTEGQEGGTFRTCSQCDVMPGPDRHDPCIGFIPGATQACCGHGLFIGYVTWPGQQVPGIWVRSARLVEKED